MSWGKSHPERPGRKETFIVYGLDRIEELIRYFSQIDWRYTTAHHADYKHSGDDDERLYGIDVNRWHERKWGACGYHAVVNPSGLIQVGYFGQNLKRGIHVGRYNTDNLGFCFIGDFETQIPTTGQLVAMERIVACQNELMPETERKLHREFNSTACPGKNFPTQLWKTGEK